MSKEEMTTPQKCEAIIKKIVEMCNSTDAVTFESDFGGNTLTILHNGLHTHVGVPDSDFDTLASNLYDTLHGGPGLSWA